MKALLGSYGGAQGRQHTDDGSGLALSYLTPQTLCHVLSISGSVSMIACAWCSAPIHPSVLSSQRREKALPPAPLQERHIQFRISHCTHVVIAAKSLKSLEVSQWLEHGYRTQPITILYIVGENSNWRSGPLYSVSLSFSTHYTEQAS